VKIPKPTKIVLTTVAIDKPAQTMPNTELTAWLKTPQSSLS
jgi:hypothetical protein